MVKAGDKTFSGNELHHMLNGLIEWDQLTRSMGRLSLNRQTVEAVLEAGLGERADFESEAGLKALAAKLEGLGHEITSTVKDDEHGLYELVARSREPGRPTYCINHDLVQSVELRRLRKIQERIDPLMSGTLTVMHGDNEHALETKEELLEHLMESGKKGLQIQRYKGLGEMNPDQLWETTMDPERRSMLEVRVEDAVEADSLFSILMGDAVEPRRQFIEDNALDVKNLDV
jgi:DNA gyrase subunit B